MIARIKSHERIDEYIYADKKKGGVLYKYLRTQKTDRKRVMPITIDVVKSSIGWILSIARLLPTIVNEWAILKVIR